MKMRMKCLCVLAGLVLAASAGAEQWFSVGGSGSQTEGTVVEIDLDTVRIRNQGGEGAIRVTFEVLQPHSAGFGYRSFVATAHFDCKQRSISLTSSAYFPLPAGSGPRLGADSSGREAGMPPELLQKIPAAARQALLKASCAPSAN
ncbi:MAG: hypothetical protein JWQ07_2440 [Ramlibacter sp.]|nr:hypothetical protein [Ramlibacter sp.]